MNVRIKYVKSFLTKPLFCVLCLYFKQECEDESLIRIYIFQLVVFFFFYALIKLHKRIEKKNTTNWNVFFGGSAEITSCCCIQQWDKYHRYMQLRNTPHLDTNKKKIIMKYDIQLIYKWIKKGLTEGCGMYKIHPRPVCLQYLQII